MQAAKYKITINRFAWFVQGFRWLQNNAAVDLSAYQARMMVRSASGTLLISLSSTSTSGEIELDASGNVTVYMNDTQTGALSVQADAKYDLLLESPDGVITKLVYGTAEIVDTQTHD